MSDEQSEDKTMPFRCAAATKDELSTDDENERSSVTPKWIIHCLPRYYIRSGDYMPADRFCGICYGKYKPGDIAICLPCQHNFHYFCIENWLRWVKATCPIDKQSVIRSNYWQDMVNERRNPFLEEYTLSDTNEIFLQFKSNENNDEKSSNFSDQENIILDHSTFNNVVRLESKCKEIPQSPETVLEEPEVDPETPEPKQPEGYSLKIVSPLPFQFDSKPSGTCSSLSHAEKNAMSTDKINFQTRCRDSKIVFPHAPQLRKSVEAIRQSLGRNNSGQKKLEKPAEYHDTLNEVVAKLSESKIHSPKIKAKCCSKKCKQKISLKNKSVTKSVKVCESHPEKAVLDERNFTFGDFVDLEKEERPVKTPLPKNMPTKYHQLLRKKS